MTLRSLLTLVDDETAAIGRARHGARLAARFDARLIGQFPRPALTVSMRDQPVYWGMPPIMDLPPPPEMVAEHERLVDLEADKARAAFESVAAAERCRSEWLTPPTDLGESVFHAMRRADLTLLPTERLPTVGPGGARPEDLALASGGPCLLIPSATATPTIGSRILVAWDGGREAARAVRDAWSFLASAKAVQIVRVDAGTPGPDRRLQRYFEDHGVGPGVVTAERTGGVADTLLDEAAAFEADLIVMGLYGHSRLRETVLGGVSREMVDQSPIPLLASH